MNKGDLVDLEVEKIATSQRHIVPREAGREVADDVRMIDAGDMSDEVGQRDEEKP